MKFRLGKAVEPLKAPSHRMNFSKHIVLDPPLITLLFSFLLSCSGKVSPSFSDYQIDFSLFETKKTLKILFLTDVHWEFQSEGAKQSAYLNALVKNSNPDLIMLGGDQVTNPINENYESFFDVCEGFSSLLGRDLYYGLVWGNHDDQTYWENLSSHSLSETNPHCLYREVEDSLSGESDYLINLKKNGKTLWQLYALDTNSYVYSSGEFSGYDSLHAEQIDWFESEVKAAKGMNPGVKNLAFLHIPLWENEYAYRLSGQSSASEGGSAPGYLGRYSGVMKEDLVSRGDLGPTRVCTSNERSPFFAKAEELGCTSAMFFGHDHINDFSAEYKLNRQSDYISLVYGLKTGDGLYYDPSLLGGTMIEIGEDMSCSIYRCFQSYEEDYSEKKGFRQENLYQ